MTLMLKSAAFYKEPGFIFNLQVEVYVKTMYEFL